MSGLAAVALSTAGGPLDIMWRVNPSAGEGFQQMGVWSIVLMVTVCAGCAAAAYGLWKMQPWGRVLAIVVLGINIVGDTANALFRHDLRTLIGIVIGGLMIRYLAKQRPLFMPEFLAAHDPG